jgi:hypothetical protein
MNESSPKEKRRPYNAAPPVGSPLSDPGLPPFSSSPQSFFIERTQSLDFLSGDGGRRDSGESLERSPSNFSEIDVILDDGTTQKRTVSLSTLPDVSEEEDAYYTKSNQKNKFR